MIVYEAKYIAKKNGLFGMPDLDYERILGLFEDQAKAKAYLYAAIREVMRDFDCIEFEHSLQETVYPGGHDIEIILSLDNCCEIQGEIIARPVY